MNIIDPDRHRAIEGAVMPGFEALADTFDEIVGAGLEQGAACAVFKDGVAVADLWGGLRDGERQLPWRHDTLVPVYSVTKGVVALLLLRLVDQGALELDEPVARYWPQFGAHGKGQLTVRAMLAHRAGLPFVDGQVDLAELADPIHMAARLAAQAPYFVPGESHLYHALTIGWLSGELARRLTGQSIGAGLATLGRQWGLEMYLGLPASARARVAVLDVQSARQRAQWREQSPAGSLAWRITTLNGAIDLMPGAGGVDLNDYRLQALELAGAGLITDARSLASFYGHCLPCAGRAPLVSAATIADACRLVSSGAPFGSEAAGAPWGAGLMLPFDVQPMLGPSSFGHDGYGGSLAFADRASGVAFAYVRNRLAPGGAKDHTVYRMVDVLRNLL